MQKVALSLYFRLHTSIMSLSQIHICSLNVQGLLNQDKRQMLIQYAKQQKIDIFFLQETHFNRNISDTLENEFQDYFIYNSYAISSHSTGTSILLRKK